MKRLGTISAASLAETMFKRSMDVREILVSDPSARDPSRCLTAETETSRSIIVESRGNENVSLPCALNVVSKKIWNNFFSIKSEQRN